MGHVLPGDELLGDQKVTAFVGRTWIMLLVGLILGTWIAFEADPIYEWAYDVYDRANPIINADAQIKRYEDQSLIIDATFHKRRNCDRIAFYAYVTMADNRVSRASLSRADTAFPPVFMEPGQSLSSELVVHPVPTDAVKVELKAVYNCGKSHLAIITLWSGDIDLAHMQ